MKSIFLILIAASLFSSCKKDHMELIRFDVHSYTGCIWANVEFRENGVLVTQANMPLSAWYHEYFREKGTNLYLKVTPLCPGEVTIFATVNGNQINNDKGTDQDPAVIEVEAKSIDDFYR